MIEGSPEYKAEMARLNDRLRITGEGGHIQGSLEVTALPLDIKNRVLDLVRSFDDFNEGNDPYGEHDFGCVEVEGEQYYWKIDYYDLALKYHSEDPTDPSVTKRVMTVLNAREY